MERAVWIAMACMACVGALLWAEWRGRRGVRGVAKMLASSAFVALAATSGGIGSMYGRWILLALALSWLGDLLLLSRRSQVFLAGIAAFLFAHVAFACAFAQRGVESTTLAMAACVFALLGAALLRWLWPHLSTLYRVAVPLYVVAILAMCTLAVATSVKGSPAVLAVAAVLFAASDISVARDRFVTSGFGNKAWGLPLYYVAQLLLAGSVLQALQ